METYFDQYFLFKFNFRINQILFYSLTLLTLKNEMIYGGKGANRYLPISYTCTSARKF